MQEQLLLQNSDNCPDKSRGNSSVFVGVPVARQSTITKEEEVNTTTNIPLNRAHAPARPPRVGDPPSAWAPYATKWEVDRNMVKRPVRNGEYVDILAEMVLDAARLNPATFRGDWRPLIGWMDEEFDGRLICEAIREVAQKPTYVPESISSLAYFDRAVRAKCTGRVAA